MHQIKKDRPNGILLLAGFFLLGSVISFVAALSLLVPQSVSEPMWRVNPRGHMGLVRMGVWGVVLLFAACAGCGIAAVGLWRGSSWGHRTALALIAINLFSDLFNALSGNEPKAIIGVPIAFAILIYLVSRKVKAYFADE